MDEKMLHEMARSLAQKEYELKIKERELDGKQRELSHWQRDLEKREASIVTTPEVVHRVETDPFSVGETVRNPVQKLSGGKVTRVSKNERGNVYHVSWPGNKSGTYSRKELMR